MLHKLLLIFTASGLSLFGQATLSLAVPGSTTQSVTFSAEMVASAQAAIKGTPPAIATQTTTTLTAAALSTDTTFNVASTANIAPCMGVLTPSGEVALVSSSTATTVTVVRARIGTTAASIANGATLQYLAWGDYPCLLKSWWLSMAQQNEQLHPGPAAAAAAATIASQQAAASTASAALVQ